MRSSFSTRCHEAVTHKIQFSQHYPLLGKKNTVIRFNSLWNKGKDQSNEGFPYPKMGNLGWRKGNHQHTALLLNRKRGLAPRIDSPSRTNSLLWWFSQPHWEGINKPAGLGTPTSGINKVNQQWKTPCVDPTLNHIRDDVKTAFYNTVWVWACSSLCNDSPDPSSSPPVHLQ